MQGKVKMDWHNYFVYDEASPSGLRWNVGRGDKVKQGDVAGRNSKGRWQVKLTLDGLTKLYLCYRIIWELHNGAIPTGMVIDHLDGDAKNNRISNLRVVTQRVNLRNKVQQSNNTSGVTGVKFQHNKSGNEYWVAHHCDNTGKLKQKYFSCAKLGNDVAKQQAIAYREARIAELCDYTERHGTYKKLKEE